jgi:hypothetical protein
VSEFGPRDSSRCVGLVWLCMLVELVAPELLSGSVSSCFDARGFATKGFDPWKNEGRNLSQIGPTCCVKLTTC